MNLARQKKLLTAGITALPVMLGGAPASAQACFTAFGGSVHYQFSLTTAVANAKVVVLGYRAMTVDAAGCGAVDEIAPLSPSTLAGPLQLHNDRNNFSNTSTLTPAPCVAVPLLASQAAPVASGQKDQAGNSAP
jgi:hypothetical protein